MRSALDSIQTFDFDVAFERCTSHGWLTKPEAELLVRAAQDTSGDIVEVGCYQGRSAMLLAQLGRTLHCVDPWDDSNDMKGDAVLAKFLENMNRIRPHRLTYQIYPYRVEDWTPVPAGFVYLDGDHTYKGTKAQVLKALECRPQAIAAHDVNDSGGGLEVKEAMLETLGPWNERVERLAIWRLG